MCKSFKTISQSKLKLSHGNQSVTDRRTEKPKTPLPEYAETGDNKIMSCSDVDLGIVYRGISTPKLMNLFHKIGYFKITFSFSLFFWEGWVPTIPT